MQYQTIYDVNQAAFPWMSVGIPLFILLISAVILFNRHAIPGVWRPVGLMLAGACLLGSLVLLLMVSIPSVFSYGSARDVLNSGRAAMVEGRVQGLEQTSYGKAESFSVDGIRFSYSQYSESVGFHQTSAFGGPISGGLNVRIWYTQVEGDPSQPVILRLDVARNS